MTRVALAFALGVGSYLLQTRPPPDGAVWLALVLSGAITLRWRRGWPLLFLALGFSHAHWAVSALRAAVFPESLVGTELILTGRLASWPEYQGERASFLFAVEEASQAGQPLHGAGMVRLFWYRPVPTLEAGARWRLAVRLKPRHGLVNFSGFDYERWLFAQRIGATGTVHAATAQLLDAGPGQFWWARLRQKMRAWLIAHLPDTPGAALARALILGDRGGLTPAHWHTFARTGTSHLVAISGLHLGLIAGAVFATARLLWAALPALALRWAAPRAAAVLALGAATGYAALAGFSVPTQRALVMLAVVLLALLAARRPHPGSGVALAAAAVLVGDPLAPLTQGFWLSFGAVVWLFYALGGRVGPLPAWRRLIRAQWAVGLGLIPLLWPWFGQISLIAFPANLVAIPLFTLLLPALLLATLVGMLTDWLWPLHSLTRGIDSIAAALAAVAAPSWATLPLGTRPLWAWLAAGLGIGLILAPRGWPGRGLSVLLLLPIALLRPPAPTPGTVTLELLDVGQGLAALVRTARHTLMYDLGPAVPSGFDTGSAVVLPALRAAGIERLDLLIISHADNDHAGGLSGLLTAGLPIDRVLSGEPQRMTGIAATFCQRGQQWQWDGVTFALLHPDRPRATGNDSSCVLRVSTGEHALLLVGDIGTALEAELTAHFGERLRATVLVVAHHGSAGSSSERFLRQVTPRLALYSAGYANRYGLPAPQVRARLAALQIPTLNTAECGAIRLNLQPNGLSALHCARPERARLWRHSPGHCACRLAPDRVLP